MKHPMRVLLRYTMLPKHISDFERTYLARINRIALGFLAIHIPLMMLLAWVNRTGPWLAAALTSAILVGPAVAYRTLKNPRAVSVTYGIAAAFMGGALVHFGQGPVQIEMHFYFFAVIGMLAVFANPAVIIAAAATVALHHLLLWFALPASVFNYEAPGWVVVVHAAFVVLESIAACFISRSFFDNVIGLERSVARRTAELATKNGEMRGVLDNVEQGFCTIDRAGSVSAERSRALDTWLGAASVNETLFDLFARHSGTFAEQSRLNWEQVLDGFMPIELTLDQMPKTLVAGEFEYRVGYAPIGDADHPERFLVVVTDVTDDNSRARAEEEQREVLHLFERCFSDRGSVNDFFDEGALMMIALSAGSDVDMPALKRTLHTLKGNSGVFGLSTLANLCHELETYMADRNAPPPPAAFAKLEHRWEQLTTEVDRIIGARRRVIELEDTDYRALEETVRRGASSRTILRMVHSLKLEPTKRRLDIFGDQVKRIAARLEKNVDVRIESHDLRVDPRQWAPFWSAFIHIIRNALDHGVESPAERVAVGKPACAIVALRTYLRGSHFIVEVREDGRGIDWARIAKRAAELGVKTGSNADLQDALFKDGLSTSIDVTELSGRGIGMGAVRAATETLGGKLEIETAAGTGTTVRMVFPEHAMAPQLHVVPREITNMERGISL